MKTLILTLFYPAFYAAQSVAAPAAVTPQHLEQVGCVAAFAIIASQQEAGSPEALDLPLLTERGREYAGIVGERVMQESGQNREEVSALIIAAVAKLQAQSKDSDKESSLPVSEMEACLPILETDIPADPLPSLPQCAAMMALAFDKVYAAEGLTKKAQDLKTLAFVLDSRARDSLKVTGMSVTEIDMAMAAEKITVSSPDAPELDIDHCFKLAAPEPKGPKKH